MGDSTLDPIDEFLEIHKVRPNGEEHAKTFTHGHTWIWTQDFCDMEGPFCGTITLGGILQQNKTTQHGAQND